MRTKATPAHSMRQPADRRTPAGMELVPIGFMTSMTNCNPMHSATGFEEKSGRMQVAPDPALEARISMVLQMFVLINLLLLLLQLLVDLFLLAAYLILQRGWEKFRPSGRSPIQLNKSQHHH